MRETVAPHNIFLLGVFAAVVPPREPGFAVYQAETLEQAIRDRLKRDLERNLAAFRAGYTHGRSLP